MVYEDDPYSLKDDWLGLIPLVALIYLAADSRNFKKPYRKTKHEKSPNKEVSQTVVSACSIYKGYSGTR